MYPNCVCAHLNGVQVAHDNAATVKIYITEDLHLLNYNTWYGVVADFPILHVVIVLYLGTKNVAKSMRKISCGAKKSEGKSWFVQTNVSGVIPMSLTI